MTVWSPNFIGDLDNLVIAQYGPGVTSGDTFVPIARGDIVDRSIQVSGTFGGATINVQGSNEATTNSNGNYVNLHDPFSNTIALTAAGLAQIVECTAWTVPSMSGATGSTSLTITICARRSFK